LGSIFLALLEYGFEVVLIVAIYLFKIFNEGLLLFLTILGLLDHLLDSPLLWLGIISSID
jgi:hypothetical protein